MLGKGRLLIKHLKVKTVLFKCSQLNDTEIVGKKNVFPVPNGSV